MSGRVQLGGGWATPAVGLGRALWMARGHARLEKAAAFDAQHGTVLSDN